MPQWLKQIFTAFKNHANKRQHPTFYIFWEFKLKTKQNNKVLPWFIRWYLLHIPLISFHIHVYHYEVDTHWVCVYGLFGVQVHHRNLLSRKNIPFNPWLTNVRQKLQPNTFIQTLFTLCISYCINEPLLTACIIKPSYIWKHFFLASIMCPPWKNE